MFAAIWIIRCSVRCLAYKYFALVNVKADAWVYRDFFILRKGKLFAARILSFSL